MLSPTDKHIMLAALAPYVALAGYDGWLHEKARRVPAPEKILHALLAVSGVALVSALFVGRSLVALPALLVFAIASAIDEFGFHGLLAAHERRLHFAAYACFAGFVGVSFWRGAMAWN
jgi:hypothetical protein